MLLYAVIYAVTSVYEHQSILCIHMYVAMYIACIPVHIHT